VDKLKTLRTLPSCTNETKMSSFILRGVVLSCGGKFTEKIGLAMTLLGLGFAISYEL